jgi:hypothetical protein
VRLTGKAGRSFPQAGDPCGETGKAGQENGSRLFKGFMIYSPYVSERI